MKVLLIDNYDSFTYNLYHYLSSLKCKVEVRRNDKIKINEIKKNKYKKIIILDIPLFLENKINKKQDIIIFIDAKKKEINKRLKKKYKSNLIIVKKLKKLQLPVEEKKKKSNYIIKNNFNDKKVKKDAKKILKYILAK